MATAPDGRNNGDELYLRIATAQDVALVCAIDKSATMKFGTIPELADLAEADDATQKVEQWLSCGRIYIVEDAGQAAGFIAARLKDGYLFIEEISVHLDHQRKGIGGMLLDAVLEWLRV